MHPFQIRWGSKMIPGFVKRYLNFNIRTIYTDILRKPRGIQYMRQVSLRGINWRQDRSVIVKLLGRATPPLRDSHSFECNHLNWLFMDGLAQWLEISLLVQEILSTSTSGGAKFEIVKWGNKCTNLRCNIFIQASNLPANFWVGSLNHEGIPVFRSD